MAEAVVHHLEVVEINEQHSDLARLSVGKESVEAFNQCTTVRKGGQLIVGRRIGQQFRSSALLSDVFDVSDRQGPVVIVGDRNPGPRPDIDAVTAAITLFECVRIRKAKRIWQSAAQAAHLDTHGHALRKRIAEPFNARRGLVHGTRVGRDADCILIPKQNIAGEFVGIEAINPQGERQSWGVNGIMPHGDLSGRVHAAEGWATGWALTQIFPGDGVVVTFGLSQLHRLGRDIAAKHGGSVVIHVDDDAHDGYDVWDWFNEGRGDEYRRKLEVCNG